MTFKENFIHLKQMSSISISSPLNIKVVQIKLGENKHQRHAHSKHTKDKAVMLPMKTILFGDIDPC